MNQEAPTSGQSDGSNERLETRLARFEAVGEGTVSRVDDLPLDRQWKRYAERLMTLSRIYGFWKFTSDLERAQADRYIRMFYHLQFRPLAARAS